MTSVPRWDAFISYASEDRDETAAPLAALLTRLGVRVWFDKTELRVGDSLRERIDTGLAESRFGIVILSPHFFRKHYPTRELNGLEEREINGAKVILPVWKGISADDVRAFSLPLANRVAARWETGIETVASELLLTIRPDIVEGVSNAVKSGARLDLVESGEQLATTLRDSHAHQYVHDEFEMEDEAEDVGAFLQELTDLIDLSGDLAPLEWARAEFRLTEQLRSLRVAGWKVFAAPIKRKLPLLGEQSLWQIAAVAVVRSDREGVALLDDQFIVWKGAGANGTETVGCPPNRPAHSPDPPPNSASG